MLSLKKQPSKSIKYPSRLELLWTLGSLALQSVPRSCLVDVHVAKHFFQLSILIWDIIDRKERAHSVFYFFSFVFFQMETYTVRSGTFHPSSFPRIHTTCQWTFDINIFRLMGLINTFQTLYHEAEAQHHAG